MLIDPTVYAWHFFTIPNDRDEAATLAELQFAFDKMLAVYCGQIGCPGDYRVQLDRPAATGSQRLLLIPQTPWGQLHVELEVRRLLDTFVLLVNVEAKGSFAVDQLPSFPEMKFGQQKIPNQLGTFTVFFAETDADDSAEVASTLHQQSLPQSTEPAEPPHVIQDGSTTIVTGPSGPVAGAAFVCARGDKTVADWFIRYWPSVALSHLKGIHCRDRLNDSLLPQLRDRDRVLCKLFDSGTLPNTGAVSETQRKRIQALLQVNRPSRLKLDDLRLVNDEVTTCRSDLTDSIVACRAECQTIQANRGNLQAATVDWAESGEPLRTALFDSIVTTIEQQTISDCVYADGTLKRADVFFDSLEASARCHDVQETRLVTMVMAFLSAIAAAALIPEIYGAADFQSLGIPARSLWTAAVPLVVLAGLFIRWTVRR